MTPRTRAAKKEKFEKLQSVIDTYAGPFEKSSEPCKEEAKVFSFAETLVKSEANQAEDQAYAEYGDG